MEEKTAEQLAGMNAEQLASYFKEKTACQN